MLWDHQRCDSTEHWPCGPRCFSGAARVLLECEVSLPSIKLDKALPVAVVRCFCCWCWCCCLLTWAAKCGTCWRNNLAGQSLPAAPKNSRYGFEGGWRPARTMANAFMCRNEKLLSACAIWTQFGNAFRHIKLKWPETSPTGAAVAPRSEGAHRTYPLLSHVSLWSCVQFAKRLTFGGKSKGQKAKAKAKEPKLGQWQRQPQWLWKAQVWEMKLFGDYAALKPNVPYTSVSLCRHLMVTHFIFIYMSVN